MGGNRGHREGKSYVSLHCLTFRSPCPCVATLRLTQEPTLRGGQVAGRTATSIGEGIVTGQQLARGALHGVLRAVPRTTCLGRLLDGGAGAVVFPPYRHAVYGSRRGAGGREKGKRTKAAGVWYPSLARDDVWVRDVATREKPLAGRAPGPAGHRVTDGKLH